MSSNMKFNLNNDVPWATITSVAITVVAAVAGACVVIWGNPGVYSFNQYLDDMKNFVIGIGLLGIGRGIHSGLQQQHSVAAEVNAEPPATTPIIEPTVVAPNLPVEHEVRAAKRRGKGAV